MERLRASPHNHEPAEHPAHDEDGGQSAQRSHVLRRKLRHEPGERPSRDDSRAERENSLRARAEFAVQRRQERFRGGGAPFERRLVRHERNRQGAVRHRL